MAYTALYRKFRPLVFEDIVGQEHITRTLRNQIVSGRIGHAYLFNGGRGTGKTSAAKVLARAINCQNAKDGEPCNECEICKGAISGALTDIVEMDAASNNGVEDIRAIRDNVNFLPTVAKYRVYIIDEVHMLSTGAFNALLKTLEEPPEHVKFILATTEPQKLPVTVLSRCQRFDFKKIPNEIIAKRLEYICKESNIEITPEAVKIISALSEGAMRDALSILERCIQDGNEKIDESIVRELTGIPKLEYVNRIVESIAGYDVDKCLMVIDEVLTEGKELLNFLWEIIKYVKDILVFKSNGKLELYSEKEISNIERIAKNISKERLLNILFELSSLEDQIKKTTQKTIIFEVGIIKLCINNKSNNFEELAEKVATLEDRVDDIQAGNVHISVQNVDNGSEKVGNIANNTKKSAPVKKKVIVPGEVVEAWPEILATLKQNGKVMIYTNLINSKGKELNDMTIGIEFPNGLTPFGKTILEKPENMQELSRLVSMKYGKEMKIKLLDDEALKQFENKQSSSEIENVVKDLDIPFNIIEE